MTQEELNGKTIIEQAVDKRISQKEGAAKLGMSERHFRRFYPDIGSMVTWGWCLDTVGSLAAPFVDHESFFAYARLCKSYFKSMGLPVALYSDRFSVFRVNSPTSINKDIITQFGRAVRTLGIEFICANSPQAKCRVERANQTFQDRLVKELRL